jgi:polar amino acid transport system substrate-binding protein
VLKDRYGHPTGYVNTLRDITEETVLKQRLVQSDKLAEMGQIAAGIAHEIKNPLGIINNAIWAIRKTTDSETVPIREELEIIGGEIHRMREIIDSMLTLSRDSKLEREEVDISELLEMILQLVQKSFSERGIELECEFHDVPPIIGNRNSLTQMFLNLLLNAGDAMPEGGKLTIGLDIDGDETVQVTISDTGQGIPREHIDKIFTPFFTTKPTREGTGLGLSLAYDTVSKHGGEITVSSTENKGTTFLIRLPLNGDVLPGGKDEEVE